MSIHTIPTRAQAGDFISERCARRVSAHRRAAVAPEPAVTTPVPVSVAPAADQTTQTATSTSTASSASGARILRRWSVAELIYSAAAGQPVVA